MEILEDKTQSGLNLASLSLTDSEKRVARFLLDNNILKAEQIQEALDRAEDRGISLQGALLQLRLIGPDVIGRMIVATGGALPAPRTKPPDGTAPKKRPPQPAPAAAAPPARPSTPSPAPVSPPTPPAPASQPVTPPADASVTPLAAPPAPSPDGQPEPAKPGDDARKSAASASRESRKVPAARRLRLGEILVEQGFVSAQNLEKGLEHAKANRMRIGEALLSLGLVKEAEVALALSRQLGLPVLNLSKNPPDPALLPKIPKRLCEKHMAIPYHLEGNVLTAAMVDPLNIIALDDFQNHTGWTVRPAIVTKTDYERAIMAYYGADDGSDLLVTVAEGDEQGRDASADIEPDAAPIVALVNRVIGLAIEKNASDIHMDPHETELSFRFRIDGVLRDMGFRCPRDAQNAIASRIKVMSSLDIAETRLPQDGKFRLKVEGKVVDFRVSILPVAWGEKIVIRLLDQSKSRATIDGLGMDTCAEKSFRKAIKSPNGVVLVTGPTGSGKSTTLYAAMLELNAPDVNIHTVEDPVEFTLLGISQVAVKPAVGLTFASALRSFLRQDPDVIVVGEIRDTETAAIALKAAMTGHLVLSTLHTNDAISTIDRLIAMGVDRFIMASALRAIVAQRLVRKLCSTCRQERPITAEELERWTVSDAMLVESGWADKPRSEIRCYEPCGCDSCTEGYRGRVGVHEVLTTDKELQDMIVGGASNWELLEKARALGMLTIRECATIRVMKGLTAFEEVSRITVSSPDRQRRDAYKMEAEGTADGKARAGAGLDPRMGGLLESIAGRLEVLATALGSPGLPAAPGAQPALPPAAPQQPTAAAPVPTSAIPGLGAVLGRISGAVASSLKLLGTDSEAGRRDLERVALHLKKLACLSASPKLVELPLDVAQLVRDEFTGELERIAGQASLVLGDPIDISGVKVSHTFDPSTPEALADRDRVREILEELLENALASLAGGGQLKVIVKPVSDEGRVFVELTVGDTGPGMAADQLADRLPFSSSRSGGLGAGLAIVERNARAMGGSIQILSKAGRGCAVRVRIPAVETPAG